MTSETFTDTLKQFLDGDLSFEAAARALSRSQETHFVSVGTLRDEDPEAAEQKVKLRALMNRVLEINTAEQLMDPRAEAPRIEDWQAPEDPTDFCFSIEVVLSGRDQQ